MPQTAALFPELLRSLLVDEQMTPSRLAALVGVKAESVEGWLTGSQLPKAKSVWAVARALGGHQGELLLSAVAWYHERIISQYPAETVLRLDKTASAYLGEGNWWEGIPAADQPQFLDIWRRFLEQRSVSITPLKDESAGSELIILPELTISVGNEWAEIVERIARDGSILHQLNWKRFEDLVATLLERYGWQATPMGYTKDQGVDIVVVRRLDPGIPFKMMVQCKRFSQNRKVGVEIVREVWSVKWEMGFHQAVIATTSGFTKGAKEKGQKWDLALKDREAIIDWCRGLSSGQQVANLVPYLGRSTGSR